VFHVERDPNPPSSTSAEPVLRSGLRELLLDEALLAPLVSLADLLASWAARMNLTGHRTPDAIARRLILDALALSAALPVPEPTSIADLGSGAGFPGLPLAIRWPRCRVTLVEARERRHHFQRAAVRTLGLVNAEPRRGRIEDLPPEPHELVVAQALARPERAIAWMLPWLAPGGWLVLPRTGHAAPLPLPPELEASQSIPYRVPAGGPDRLLWIARRPVDGGSAAVVRTGRPPH
jgi:16S rRNA (guanine527-N7)-methyltransferase